MNEREAGMWIVGVALLCFAFILTSCEKKHVGDTYIVNSKPDDGSSSTVEINRENSNNDNTSNNSNSNK